MARVLGQMHESPGTTGRTRAPSDSSAGHPGSLVDHEGLWTQAPVARDSWSTAQALAHKCECPGTAGRLGVPTDPGRNHPEYLVGTAGPWQRVRVGWETWSTPRALGPKRECPGQLVEQAGPQSQDGVAKNICLTP